MATRVCPNCGSQYVASVRRCIDCDVMLVDEVGLGDEPVVSTASPVGAGDQIAYELEGWGSQLKVTLEGMLDRAGIARVWEAGALVVPAEHEDEVDELVATVEGGEVVELEDDMPQIAFEIEGLTIDELSDLDARLIAAHIGHAWEEGGALLVGEADEAAVAEMIDEVLNADPAEDDDGLALHRALDELFVAVDKLYKDPADTKLVTRFEAAATGLDGLGVPYGFSADGWAELVAEVTALREALRVATQERAEGQPAPADQGLDEDPESESGNGVDPADDDDAEAAETSADEAAPEVIASRTEVAAGLARDLRGRLRDLV